MIRDRLVSFFFVSLLIFIFYQICLIFSIFFEPIFWACVLAFVFYPLYNKLLKGLSNHKTPAALLTLLIILLTVLPLLAILIVHLAIEAARFYHFFWNAVETGRLKDLMDHVRQLPFVHRLESHEVLASFIHKNSQSWVLNAAKSLGSLTARHAALITKNIFLFGLDLVLTLFLSFFFLKDGDKIYRFIYTITPLDEPDKKHIFEQITNTFAAVIHGQILTAIAQAIVAGIIFWSLKLPLPIFFCKPHVSCGVYSGDGSVVGMGRVRDLLCHGSAIPQGASFISSGDLHHQLGG